MRAELAATAALGVVAAACGSPPRSSPPGAPSAPPPAAGASAPAAAPGLDPAAFDAWADRELAKALPSAVIAIADRTGLRWHRGVGSRDARGGPPPDRGTVYRIGSITKLLTGTAVLQLRDAGALALDDRVARWIPELPALGASTPPVSIRHLVTHTSGIPSLGDGSAVYWEQRPPDRAQLIRALAAPLEFAPGTRSAYSNAGMALAGEIVARASGEPYRGYLARRVLGPIGMRTAAWDRAAVPPDRLAIGVREGGTIDPPHWQLGAFEPSGGLYASLEDMAAFARFALGGMPQVLAPASLDEAQRDDPLPGEHGVAWVAGSRDGIRFAFHNGSTQDYSATLIVLPERGLAAIVLAAGPNVDLVDCAAAAVLRTAATGAPLGSCSHEPGELGEAERAVAGAALVRLRAVLADPTEATVAAAFAPAFLSQVPAVALAQLVGELAQRVGRCDRHELAGGGRRLPARAILHCERGTVPLEIAAEAEPPHRITGLWFPGS